MISLLIQLCGVECPYSRTLEQHGKDSPFPPPHPGRSETYDLASAYHIKTSSSGFSLTGLPGISPTGERGLRWELLKVSVSRRANAIYVNMLLCTDSNSAGCRYPA